MIKNISDRCDRRTQPHPSSLKKSVNLSRIGVCLLPLTLWLLPLTTLPASARDNDYDRCAADLLSRDLPPETVALACSSGLYPEELSTCVVEIDAKTDAIALDALNTCQQVRRPLELATCVVDIADLSTEGDVPLILDFCRRSLLPKQFSQCVVGLKNELDLVTPQALSLCIDARDRILNPLPSFIPGKEPPVQPPATPDLPST